MVNKYPALQEGDMMKRWFQSRTIWLGVATVASAALSALASGGGIEQIVLAAIGAANVYLRMSTDKPIKPLVK